MFPVVPSLADMMKFTNLKQLKMKLEVDDVIWDANDQDRNVKGVAEVDE